MTDDFDLDKWLLDKETEEEKSEMYYNLLEVPEYELTDD